MNRGVGAAYRWQADEAGRVVVVDTLVNPFLAKVEKTNVDKALAAMHAYHAVSARGRFLLQIADLVPVADTMARDDALAHVVLRALSEGWVANALSESRGGDADAAWRSVMREIRELCGEACAVRVINIVNACLAKHACGVHV